LLEGAASLKRKCLDKLQAQLDDVERDLVARLQADAEPLAIDLSRSVDAALGQALVRYDGAIAHIIEADRRRIEREHERLRDLAEVRADLDAEQRLFSTLATEAEQAIANVRSS
jgi:septal ring factor EnvC (AmiA/AmiB activator)